MSRLGGSTTSYTTSDTWIASDNNIVNDPSDFDFNPPAAHPDAEFQQLSAVDILSPMELRNNQAHPSPVVFTAPGVSNTSMGPGTIVYWGNHPDHEGEFLAQLQGTTGITDTTTVSRSAVTVTSAIGANINYAITAFSENYSQKWMYLEKFGGPLDTNDKVTFTPTDDGVVVNTGVYNISYDSYYTLGVDPVNYEIQLTSNSSYPGGSGHGVPKGVKVIIEADWDVTAGGVPVPVLFSNPNLFR